MVASKQNLIRILSSVCKHVVTSLRDESSRVSERRCYVNGGYETKISSTSPL
jgi:hypothetical protein